MKIHNVEKIVTVFAYVDTNIGEFRVTKSSDVEKWNFSFDQWVEYGHYEDYRDEISRAGLQVLQTNKE